MRLRSRCFGDISAQAKVAQLDVAVTIEKQVAGLDISVQEVGGVHKFERLHQLVDYVLLVNLLQNIGSNNGMEICLCGRKTLQDDRQFRC